jgi:hypothetical protein
VQRPWGRCVDDTFKEQRRGRIHTGHFLWPSVVTSKSSTAHTAPDSQMLFCLQLSLKPEFWIPGPNSWDSTCRSVHPPLNTK